MYVERRNRARYPVQLPARYQSLERGQRIEGVGLTVNMSSKGLLITCQHELQLGTRLEVRINWPSLLESTVPLQLVASGRVIRCEGFAFALEFAQYQFRTMKTKPLVPHASGLRTADSAADSRALSEPRL